MKTLTFVIKLFGLCCIIPGLMHIGLGLGADVLLGAQLSIDAISDPALDSQNRFYSSVFACYGLLIMVAASDIERYAVILKILILFMFLGGLVRLLSLLATGSPPAAIYFLLATELLIPPALAIWWRRASAEAVLANVSN